MLSFAAITPHPPIMIPNIGGENLEKISSTVKAMKKLGDILVQTNSDSLIIISPHGVILPHAFTVGFSTKFNGDFKNFGDFITESKFSCDTVLAQKIKEEATSPVVYNNDSNIDHGVSAPLFYLAAKIKDLPIVPIGYSFLPLKDIYNFGKELYNIISQTDKRIAVVASGDLSHCLTKDAPAGFSPKGEIFDNKLVKLIKEKKSKSILRLDADLIKEAEECGLRAIVILLGILNNIDYNPEILSYEGPFGVGYLAANFKLDI